MSTARGYVIGFISSLVLTLAAYILTVNEVYRGWTLIGVLAALAIAQLLVQLAFFLHLGSEPRPRWNLWTASFAILVVVAVVGGSLWIMSNLRYNHDHHGLTPDQTDRLLIEDEGFHED